MQNIVVTKKINFLIENVQVEKAQTIRFMAFLNDFYLHFRSQIVMKSVDLDCDMKYIYNIHNYNPLILVAKDFY